MGPPRVQAGVPGRAPRTGGPGELRREEGWRPAGATGLPSLSPSSQGDDPLGSSCPRAPGLQPYLIVLTCFHFVIELPPLTLVSPTCFQGLSGASPQGQGAPRDRGFLSRAFFSLPKRQGLSLSLQRDGLWRWSPGDNDRSGGLRRESSVPRPRTPGRSQRLGGQPDSLDPRPEPIWALGTGAPSLVPALGLRTQETAQQSCDKTECLRGDPGLRVLHITFSCQGRLPGAEGARGGPQFQTQVAGSPGVQTPGPAPPALASPGFMAPVWVCLDTGQRPGILAVLTR